jgi:prolycopene isomerase
MVAYGPDSGLVAEGKWILKVEAQGSYAHWKKLREDRAAYKQQKQEAAGRILERLEARFPGLRGRVEVTDVSTLPTVERYTGNRFGYQPAPP